MPLDLEILALADQDLVYWLIHAGVQIYDPTQDGKNVSARNLKLYSPSIRTVPNSKLQHQERNVYGESLS